MNGLSPDPASVKSDRSPAVIAAIAAGVITLLVYAQALRCGFVNLDDPIFVVNNPNIRGLDSNLLAWAFTKPLDLWIPLTWISFALDYQFWQLDPFGYHLTNIILHTINASLVVLIADYLLRDRLHRRPGMPLPRGIYSFCLLFAGLVFALHPLKVESVAWVTERKDVLNGLFTLSSLCFYLRHVHANVAGDGKRGWSWYLISLFLFFCSLLAKPVSVVMPLVLLLADWYPLQRFGRESRRRILVEKIPFFVVSLVIGVITIHFFSQKNLLVGLSTFSIANRFFYSGNALFEYCRLAILPVGVLPFYEIPDGVPMSYVLKTGIVVALTIYALRVVGKKGSCAVVWLFFMLPVLPVLAFFQNNDVAFAARYTYLPLVAPSIAAAGVLAAVHRKMSHGGWLPGKIPLVGVSFLLLLYAGITSRLISVWHDTETLWTRVIALNPATTKYMDRGVYYILNNRPEAAAADFSLAIEWLAKRGKVPDYNAYAFRGLARIDLRQFEDAVKDFTVALALKPHPTYYYYRGVALQALGKNKEAEADFNLAGPNPPPIDTF